MGKKESIPSQRLRQQSPSPEYTFEYEAIRMKGAHVKFYVQSGRTYFEAEDKEKGTIECTVYFVLNGF